MRDKSKKSLNRNKIWNKQKRYPEQHVKHKKFMFVYFYCKTVSVYNLNISKNLP